MAKKLDLGDFNFWMDQQNSVDANKFRSILNIFGIQNHVKRPTHNLGHPLTLLLIVLKNL